MIVIFFFFPCRGREVNIQMEMKLEQLILKRVLNIWPEVVDFVLVATDGYSKVLHIHRILQTEGPP